MQEDYPTWNDGGKETQEDYPIPKLKNTQEDNFTMEQWQKRKTTRLPYIFCVSFEDVG